MVKLQGNLKPPLKHPVLLEQIDNRFGLFVRRRVVVIEGNWFEQFSRYFNKLVGRRYTWKVVGAKKLQFMTWYQFKERRGIFVGDILMSFNSEQKGVAAFGLFSNKPVVNVWKIIKNG